MVKNNENDQLSTTLNINSGLDSFFVFLPLPSSLTSTHSILRFNPLFVMNLFRFFFHEKIGFISGLCHGFKMLSVSQKFCFRTFFLFQLPSSLPSIYCILPLLIWIEVKKETCFLGLNSKTISTSQKSGYCDKSSKFDYSSKISVILKLGFKKK